jgi:hypothetical protein
LIVEMAWRIKNTNYSSNPNPDESSWCNHVFYVPVMIE